MTYNLIRTIIAQAAAIHDFAPRSISFKGACQTPEAFQTIIDCRRDSTPNADLSFIFTRWTRSQRTVSPIGLTELSRD